MKTFGQLAASRCENRDFLGQFCVSAKLPYVFMAYFDLEAMKFMEFWTARDPGFDGASAAEIAKSLERRIAGYLKVHQVFSDVVSNKVRAMQRDNSLWISSGNELIGIGEFTGKIAPVIAFPRSADDDAPERKALFRIGLAHVVQELNKKAFMRSAWHEGILKTAMNTLSFEFVVVNERGEIVHDARRNDAWPDRRADARSSASVPFAFNKRADGPEFHNAVMAAVSPERRTTVVPVFDEDRSPQLVIVTPLKGSDPRLALVIFESDKTDHDGLLKQFFDIYNLTPSEKQIAQGIVLGQSVTEIAASAGLSVATVRSHVKQIFAKMGLHRQSELITLYYSSTLPMVRGLAEQVETGLRS